MKLKKPLLVFAAWLAPLVAYVIYKLQTPPILCWDGVDTDPITGELIKVGGCGPEYSRALQMLIWPTTIWVAILVVVLVMCFKFKKL